MWGVVLSCGHGPYGSICYQITIVRNTGGHLIETFDVI